MNKRVILFITMIFSVIILSGFSSCHGPQYEESEKTEMEEKGSAVMQAWLDEYIPGSKVLSAEAYVERYPSGPYYLSDIVDGSFNDGEMDRKYEVKIENGEVFLEGDMNFLTERVKPYILEALKLSGKSPECSFRGFNVSMQQEATLFRKGKAHDEKSVDVEMLPGELVIALTEADPEGMREFLNRNEDDIINWNQEACVLIDEFVKKSDKRPVICVKGDITIPEDCDLQKYNMAFFDSLNKTEGLYFRYVSLCQHPGTLKEDIFAPDSMGPYYIEVTCNGRNTEYERYVRKPFEDFFIEYKEEYYREESRNGTITVKEQYKNDVGRLSMNKTENGYGFSFKDDDWFIFTILTDGSSKLNEHEYTDRFDQAANLGSGSYGGNRYIDHELHWKKRDDGALILANDDGTAAWLDNADELIIRD
ncbi:hypothetical protein SAMN05216349_12914 [Oribacterium sp. KHPX15]|uniref:hypothetical protein n=1 Tax=unclassified Oribacterium TaxID=2629782 RepID=UPI0004E0EC87|nr:MULTISPECIES: hypothetical protein [unclassified Oribacterium]SEA79261.1 hypothetical protein SAMN05216349_12914 [Oribacterium sp. KHPX15]